jgi:hypothetical protein
MCPANSTSAPIERHPERAALEERLSELRRELATTLDEWYELQHKVIPELRSEYEKHFREIEIELQTESLRCADLARREELFRTKIERGEKLTAEVINLVHEFVDREFAKLRERLQNLAEKDKRRRERRRQKLAKQELKELPGIYRELVKKLHPDAGADNTDFSKYWQRAQNAYESRNLARLKSIYAIVCGDQQSRDATQAKSNLSLEHLRDEVASLERRVDYEQRKNAALENSEPLIWREDLYRESWLEQQRNRLNDEINAKKLEAGRHARFLDSILGDDWEEQWKAYCKTPEAKQRRAFDEDFMQSSYFGGR